MIQINSVKGDYEVLLYIISNLVEYYVQFRTSWLMMKNLGMVLRASHRWLFHHKIRLQILNETTIFKYKKCYYSEEGDYLYFISPKEKNTGKDFGCNIRNLNLKEDFLLL